MLSLAKLFVVLCATAHMQIILAAWTNMSNRLKDLVIHFETRREGYEKYWLVRSSYYDVDVDLSHDYYSRFAQYSDQEVYSVEKTKWLVKDCGDGWLCFECVEAQNGQMPLRNRFLRASKTSNGMHRLVKLKKNYSPETDENYHHKVECETDEMLKCRMTSKRFNADFWAMEKISVVPFGPDAHYLVYSKTDYTRYFRILAPAPSDTYITIYEGTNEGNVATPPYTKTMEIGMASSTSTSQTVTVSTTLEVSSSFLKFGNSGVSQTVESSWTEASSQVFAAKITKSYEFSIEPRSHLKVKQLKGVYGEGYNVFSEVYYYEVDYLDDPSKSYKSKMMKFDLDARKIVLDLKNVTENKATVESKSEL